MRLEKLVLYVLGNHAFYGNCIDGAAAELKRLCAGTRVQVLGDAEVVIGNVRFLGATLWTDFELFGETGKKAAAMAEARRLIRDFSRIAQGPGACGNTHRRWYRHHAVHEHTAASGEGPAATAPDPAVFQPPTG